MKICLSLLILLGLSATCIAQNGKARRSDGTECTAFPCVVATLTLIDQSQNLPSTPIFTPTSTGVFRINAYMSTSTGSVKRAVWTLYLGSTGDNGSHRYGTGSGPGADNAYNATFVTQDIGGQPLLYQTKLGGGGGSGGMTYNLYITVEQLQ